SYFHIAMNGMAASDKIFRLLDVPEAAPGTRVPMGHDIALRGVHFSYDGEREVLRDVSMVFPEGSFTAIVGESGCGKSTVAALLTGQNRGFTGQVTIGGVPVEQIRADALMQTVTCIGHASRLFVGTVRDNLLMARPNATDEALWQVLAQVKLADFLRAEKGLDTPLTEQGSNLSGGQRQRLALARALLHDSPVYIFDEATSNIDVESENDIMAQIYALAKVKTVILISHRLANVIAADNIYVMRDGQVVESGTHLTLPQNGCFDRLWQAQQKLEQYIGKEVMA
ncbi:MAG: ABC transporter ATP-binding protein/permease, partial [Aristaeellaceae bacterium]